MTFVNCQLNQLFSNNEAATPNPDTLVDSSTKVRKCNKRQHKKAINWHILRMKMISGWLWQYFGDCRHLPCRKVRNCRVDDVLPCQGTTQGRQGLVATNILSGGTGECGCNQVPWRFWPMWSVTMVNTTNLANPSSDLHIVSAASPCCVWVKEFHFFEIQAHLAEDTADHLLSWELSLYAIFPYECVLLSPYY